VIDEAPAEGQVADGTWVLPLPPRVEPVTHARGSLLVASREQLRAAGVFDAYAAALAPAEREALGQVIAASWIPIALAHAHFEAIDSIGVDPAGVERNTRAVAGKLNGLFLATAVRAAGMTPWSGARLLPAAWKRVFQGGAVALRKLGPKESLVVVSGNSLMKHRYHRSGFRVHVHRGLELLSRRSFVREVSYEPVRYELALRLQWV
jgi:hypothetical protein